MWMLLALLLTLAVPRPSAPQEALRTGAMCAAHAAGALDGVVTAIRISAHAGLRAAGRYVAGQADAGQFIRRLPAHARVRVARLQWWMWRHLQNVTNRGDVTVVHLASIPVRE